MSRFRAACGVLAVFAVLVTSSLASPAAATPEHPANGVYLVFFPEPPLAVYEGGVPGLEPTHPAVRGERRLDPRSPASRAYLGWLEGRQGERLAAIEAALGRTVPVIFAYRAAGNGLALRLSAAEAEVVRGLAGVAEVVPDRDQPLDTDRGPVFIGADTIWDGSQTGGLPGSEGEGAVVGVIDSGVNMDHPSFSDQPVDGHAYENPLGAGNHVGWCDPGNPNFDPQFVCNEKLIGAWDFADAVSVDDDGPEDSDGHGSHTASTAAGNHLDYSDDGVADISGVAPHANLITYDACYVDPGSGLGLCPFSATSASVDQAVLDGVVDAINYSISGGGNPWGGSDIDSFFLNAVAAGIFVAASAGNSGPTPGTVAHLGPWMTTVAASTHDRVQHDNALVDMGGGISPPADIAGQSRTAAYGPAPIVYAGDYANGDPDPEQCLSPFPAGTWSGEIVVCDRGSIARVLKGQNVADGGAGGLVLANVAGGATGLASDAHVVPAIHVEVAGGDALRTWLASGSGHTATITASTMVLDPDQGDVMADFSSRGPNDSFDVLKPDVSNPGVNVYAAVATGFFDEPDLAFDGIELFWLSGTSMSSPHTAGSGALLRSLHPDWSPTQIKSALMTTGTTALLKEDGVTPADAFDVGAGRVDLSAAGRAGLLLDESEAAYRAAEPALGGDPGALNLPSLAAGDCAGSCAWSRTVEGSAASGVSWTVTATAPTGVAMAVAPATFGVAPGGTVTLDVGAKALPGAVLDAWELGELVLTPDDATVPTAHFPVAVRPTAVEAVALSATGVCPGSVDVDLTGAVPHGDAAFLASDSPGFFVVPGGPCAGTVLNLATPSLLVRRTPDADGAVSFTASPPAGACGRRLQVLDLASCLVSNVAVLP